MFNNQFDDIHRHLKQVLANQEKIMASLADIQASNVALIAAVKAEDDVVDGAVVLINGLAKSMVDIKAQLAAAIASNDPVAMQAVVDSMTATIGDVNAKKQALADAVAANTPAP